MCLSTGLEVARVDLDKLHPVGIGWHVRTGDALGSVQSFRTEDRLTATAKSRIAIEVGNREITGGANRGVLW